MFSVERNQYQIILQVSMPIIHPIFYQLDQWLFQAVCCAVIFIAIIYTKDNNSNSHYSKRDESGWRQTLWRKTTQVAMKVGDSMQHFIDSLQTKHRPGQGSTYNLGASRRYSCHHTKLFAMTLIAMAAAQNSRYAEGGPFDTDSELVGIDNRCSGCITHVRSDIPGEVVETNRTIKGFGGTRLFKVWSGTIHWNWDDDEGVTHEMIIPNSFYVPDGHVRLLSPQHWAQQRPSNRDRQGGGAGETTNAVRCKLY